MRVSVLPLPITTKSEDVGHCETREWMFDSAESLFGALRRSRPGIPLGSRSPRFVSLSLLPNYQ